ncbi:MAG TPA: Vms1/Ankzf1 family peptidyl-tRNA hydrolase, partial [Baekduia sp.]|uniref:Vms1/Ankzf1 family peptidyl-tRNA hydrolase n=1 Tax=Baekduia sp. TaxID=2600305 RepID=UPI002B735FFC
DSAVAGRPRHDAESAAADLAAKVLLPHRDDLEAVVLAGERRALGVVIEDPRLRGLARLAGEEIIDVADHRLQNLRRLPERFRATVIRPA